MFRKYPYLRYLFSAFLLSGIVPSSAQKIWIDTDIAIGKFGHDVDDGIALIMALHSPRLQIKGISLVSNPGYGYRVSQRILLGYGDMRTKIPVYKGARSANQLGEDTEAVQALTKALTKERMSIIALGPVTNIASLLLLHPALKDSIEEIIWCAGRRPFTHFSPGHGKINVCDCNFDNATAAGEILVSSGVRIVLSGYESASSISISMKDIHPLTESNHILDKWLYRQLRSWWKIWSLFLGSEAFIPFDAVTIGSFLYPTLTSINKSMPVHIEDHPNDSPLFIFKQMKPYLIVSPELVSPNKVDYCSMIDLKFKEEMLHLLFNCKPGY